MELDLNNLDKNQEIENLIVTDMKGTEVSIGYSRSGYIRLNIQNDKTFIPWIHTGYEMRPCFSLDIETASNLVRLLKSYHKKEELDFDSLQDIYQTQMLFFRSNHTLLIMGTFQSYNRKNAHWNDKYIKLKLNDLPPIINKIEELVKNS